ncbi:MAG: amidohydrolase family protein [Synergistaceae bacterium]|nr:amidohydrolase family protein [Synergistaceae bacterium]MBQ9575136.1 amidohydrolase family protein [Synergistaceae bacterium]
MKRGALLIVMEHTQDEKISLINGRIHTPSGTASNITFEHGRIVSVDDEISGLNGKIIDLHGRTVLPGFVDTGTDFLAWSENQERLNLSGIHSVRELSESLETYSRANPEPLRGWYIAYGLPEEVIISRDDIDAAVPALPCAVIDAKKSHAVLNTPAMNEFNMPQDNVELDEFTQHLPDLSEEDIISLVKTYYPKLNALGITEIWSNFYGDAKRLWDIFFSDVYDLLTLRLRCNFGFNDVSALNEFLSEGLRTGDGLPFCKLGGIIIGGNLEQQEQKNMIYSAHLSGCQVISDNNKSCLNALERVIKKSRKNSRHLIRGITGSLIERMRLLGLGGIMMPGQEDDFIHETFRNGLVISSGSGENVKPPVKIIGDLVSHGLSTAEALSIYTWSASWNAGTESRRGELAVGNDADIVVLEQDPFSVRPEEVCGIDVAMTFCAGCAVYDSGAI